MYVIIAQSIVSSKLDAIAVPRLFPFANSPQSVYNQAVLMGIIAPRLPPGAEVFIRRTTKGACFFGLPFFVLRLEINYANS